jgi:hypothetical protein
LVLLIDDHAKAIYKGNGWEASQALTARMRELLN